MVAELGLDGALHVADLAIAEHDGVELRNHLPGTKRSQSATRFTGRTRRMFGGESTKILSGLNSFL